MHTQSAMAQGSFTRSAGREPMKVESYFCPADVEDVYSTVEWDRRTAHIKDENGKVLFEQTDCEIPKTWIAAGDQRRRHQVLLRRTRHRRTRDAASGR